MGSDVEIDKKATALVVIDLQKGIVARPVAPHDSKAVIANAARLADAFRKNSMPIFLVHVVALQEDRLNPRTDESFSMQGPMPSDWAEIVPELGPKQGDMIITKKQWGAFYGTELDLQLRRRKIDTIVLCGIATNYGVESTARFAYEYGYNQIFAEDAMAAMAEEAHSNSIKYAFRRMGMVRSTEEILKALE